MTSDSATVGMEERISRWSHWNLLPTVVIDCSSDHATAKDERFKGIGWITIAIGLSGKTQGLISSQVFQLEDERVRNISISFKDIVRDVLWIFSGKFLKKLLRTSFREFDVVVCLVARFFIT